MLMMGTMNQPFNQPIEEEIIEEQNTINETTNGAAEMMMAETFTSDFYQIPSQGGLPVRLTVESRRPFTPPFAQLMRAIPPQKSVDKSAHQTYLNDNIEEEIVTQTPIQKDQSFGKNKAAPDLQRQVLKQTSSTDGLLDESK